VRVRGGDGERETHELSDRGTGGGFDAKKDDGEDKNDVGEVTDVCRFAVEEIGEGASVFDVDCWSRGKQSVLGVTVRLDADSFRYETYKGDENDERRGADVLRCSGSVRWVYDNI
jgi:hypothetical protein